MEQNVLKLVHIWFKLRWRVCISEESATFVAWNRMRC